MSLIIRAGNTTQLDNRRLQAGRFNHRRVARMLFESRPFNTTLGLKRPCKTVCYSINPSTRAYIVGRVGAYVGMSDSTWCNGWPYYYPAQTGPPRLLNNCRLGKAR